MIISKLKSVFLNNITLAFLLSFPFIFIVNRFIDKYEIEITDPINLNMYKCLFFNDLNNDGNSDKIYFGENKIGNVYCKVYDPAHCGQFNTSGNFIGDYSFNTWFDDVDGDGFNEIMFLTQKDTANVFLNIVNYKKDIKREFKICEVGTPGKRDFGTGIWDFIDLNNDGKKEIIIKVEAGFGLQPRAIYSLNPYNGELKRTPKIGSKFGQLKIEDIDNDNFHEIVCGTFTYQNYDSLLHFPYDDNWSRLFVLDHNLKFEFEPLQFTDHRSELHPFIIKNDSLTKIFSFLDTRGNKLMKNEQHIIAPNGEILKTKLFVEGNSFLNCEPVVVQSDNILMVFDGEGNLYTVSTELKLEKIKELSQYKNCHLRKIDVNSDGSQEYVFANQETGVITIMDNKFKHPVSFYISEKYVSWITPILKNEENNSYLVRNKKDHHYITYKQNKYWNFRFVLMLGFYAFFYLLLFILNRIQSYKLKEKLRTERELQKMQYRVITSRFSPHYTFNVLNTLSAQVYDEEKPEIYDYFSKFIRQLRYLYDDKNAVTRSLKDEINFCRDYLDIQKMRFPKKLNYDIKVEENLNLSVQIPKMMLHIFVENAFKHGLRPYEKDGLITINIGWSGIQSAQKEGINKILVTITDNGIGYKAAKIYSKENPHFSSGRGLEMLYEFVALYNKGKKEKIKIITTDLLDDDKSTGTRVVIIIPVL